MTMNQDIKELVISRLQVLPGNRLLSIGGYGSFTKDQVIQHVKDEDEVGEKIVQIEMEFLRAIKEGTLYA
ncbi:hypothetical protein HY993_00440 [Candidatus Micrarchaeota archaeon]|nr:hypothetical protein [Candidatus Micrarchaeota archaeon]